MQFATDDLRFQNQAPCTETIKRMDGALFERGAQEAFVGGTDAARWRTFPLSAARGAEMYLRIGAKGPNPDFVIVDDLG
jgi:hypothetical protein